MNSSHVEEVLRHAPTVPLISTHPTSCLPPLAPYICQYPPAGYLRTVLYGILTYMQCVLHPSILSEIDESPIIMGVEEQHLNVNSIEICNTFAGIEYAFDSSLVALFPCWPAMVMAVMTCTPDFRKC